MLLNENEVCVFVQRLELWNKMFEPEEKIFLNRVVLNRCSWEKEKIEY